MKMETTKKWGLRLANMYYLPYVFSSQKEAADFLKEYPEYAKVKVHVAPIQEVRMVEDKKNFYEELQQIRSRVLTGIC